MRFGKAAQEAAGGRGWGEQESHSGDRRRPLRVRIHPHPVPGVTNVRTKHEELPDATTSGFLEK